jgi:predicted nuclease of predicted toxin-antitoxin system
MRFLVDECIGLFVARWLREQGHEVFPVYERARGSADEAILQEAVAGNWILVTSDKDFGAKVYRQGLEHRGIVLLRLDDERPKAQVQALAQLLPRYADRLADSFVVVTETRVRFAHP